MPIEKGYIKLHRSIWDSEIAEKPAHYFKLWLWLLCEANHSNHSKTLQRGQLITSYDTIIQVLKGVYGNRKKLFKKHHVETVLKHLWKAGMITKRKTTRGLIITICNYDIYQGNSNSETDTETDTETVSKLTENRHDKQKLKNERSVLAETHNFSLEDIKERFKKVCETHNLLIPKGTVDSFYNHYSGNGWKRTGSNVPIKSIESVMLQWAKNPKKSIS
jgi:hypothetical protein